MILLGFLPFIHSFFLSLKIGPHSLREYPKLDAGVGLVSYRSTLPETNSKQTHLKTDDWKTFSFPFGARPIFKGYC